VVTRDWLSPHWGQPEQKPYAMQRIHQQKLLIIITHTQTDRLVKLSYRRERVLHE